MAKYKVRNVEYIIEDEWLNETMRDFDIPKDKAVRMYFEDMDILKPTDTDTIEEVATIKAKRKYTKSDKPRKKSTRERKVDEEKAEILNLLIQGYTEKYPRMVQVKNEVEFSFRHNGNDYTVKLVKHRPLKNA